MAKKVYIHYEPRDEDHLTYTCEFSATLTALQFQEYFVTHLCFLGTEQFKCCHEALFDFRTVILEDESGRVINANPKVLVSELMDDQDGSPDFYVRTRPLQYGREHKARMEAQKEERTKIVAALNKKVGGSATIALTSNDTHITYDSELIAARNKLEELIEKKQYRLCKPIINYLVEKNFNKSFALTTLTAIHTESKRYDEAIQCGQQAVVTQYQNYEAYYFLAKAYYAKGQYEDVTELLNTAMNVWKLNKNTSRASRDESLFLDFVALQAEAYFADGEHGEAANLLNMVMGNPLCDRHLNILASYATFAFQYRKLEETIVALLKAIALRRQDPRISKLLGEALSTREGFAELLRQFPPSSQEAASVYAYLGTATEEESCFEASVQLYQCAMRLQPDNPNLVLNVVHVCEAKRDYDEGIEFLKTFFARNATQGFDVGVSGTVATCARMGEALQPPSSSSARRCVIRWVELSSSSAVAPATASRQALELQRGRGQGQGFVEYIVESKRRSHVESAAGDDTPPEDDGSLALQPASPSSRRADSDAQGWMANPRMAYVFSTREFNLIGLYATTVKVCFLQGLLSHLPPMVACIESVRNLSEKPLHETMVRNEVAYYSDIVQLLALRTQEPQLFGLPDVSHAINDPMKSNKLFFLEARQRPLYLVGDSHVLSAAWSVLNVHALPRLVLPKLVTGVKMWHLRTESRFYPKESFFRTVIALPSGVDVVFNLGEIDCREGLLLALERDYYETMDDAIAATVLIFIKILKDLRKARRFNIYIHPIPPVLPETRGVVMRFNAHYRESIQRMQDDGVQWLDFLPELLDCTSEPKVCVRDMSDAALLEAAQRGQLVLKEEYQHDGTHLSPRYLPLLERAMNKCPKPKVANSEPGIPTTIVSSTGYVYSHNSGLGNALPAPSSASKGKKK